MSLCQCVLSVHRDGFGKGEMSMRGDRAMGYNVRYHIISERKLVFCIVILGRLV